MISHKVSTTYNLEHVSTPIISGESDMEFTLIDGGTVSIGKTELWNVFNVLASDEFESLCHHINMREDAYVEASKAYADITCSEELDATLLYDYGHYMKRYGYHRAKVETLRDAIIKSVGWGVWVDSTRVYESISGTQREWLS